MRIAIVVQSVQKLPSEDSFEFLPNTLNTDAAGLARFVTFPHPSEKIAAGYPF